MWGLQAALLVGTVLSAVAGQNGYPSGQGYGAAPRVQCSDHCEHYYAQAAYYESADPWHSCVNGCQYYLAHEQRVGNDPINVLNNCNYSCDERYYEDLSQSCKAGCSFNYDAAVAHNQEMQQAYLQASPRSSRMEEIELPAETEQPPMIIQHQSQQQSQPLPPFLQLLNRVIPRINMIMQQSLPRQFQMESAEQAISEPLMLMPPQEVVNNNDDVVVEQDNQNQPEFETNSMIRSFIIPLSSSGESPVESMFGMKQSEDPSPVFSQLFETASNIMQGIPNMSGMNMDSPFSNPFSSFMRPGGMSEGEIIISRSGPGYSETKHYNLNNGELVEIDEEANMGNDGLAHVNPMDTEFNSDDVEMLDPMFLQQHNNQQQVVPALEAEEHSFMSNPFGNFPAEQLFVQDPYMGGEFMENIDYNSNDSNENIIADSSEESELPLALEKEIEAEVKTMVENESEEDRNAVAVEAEPQVQLKHDEEHPFREFVVELDSNDMKSLRERLMELINWRREQARADYRDVNCDSDSLPLKDWLACAHLNVGVPRWLTAATIALAIIFTVWLCLVIPSSAPKRKIKSLVIKTHKLAKPSEAAEMTAAEAKEAEANATREPVIAVIKVDLPPNYQAVAAPPSPVPSYKSNMTPGSPAPSYKSIDTPIATPVHYGKSEMEKDSAAKKATDNDKNESVA